jgi:hypothetical protein
MVNISLLTKWCWKLLSGSHALWKDVIRSKYGDEVVGKVDWSEGGKPWFSSLWWKNLCSIGHNLDYNWFARSVNIKLGNGVNTSFWLDIWIGNSSLKDLFPRLYSISNKKEAIVADLWGMAEGVKWNMVWRRRLFDWEQTHVEELMTVLQPIVLTAQEDKWSWILELDGDFSVKSTYILVSGLMADRGRLPTELSTAFKAIWKCPTPSKVLGFAWLLLLDRIPTKANFSEEN